MYARKGCQFVYKGSCLSSLGLFPKVACLRTSFLYLVCRVLIASFVTVVLLATALDVTSRYYGNWKCHACLNGKNAVTSSSMFSKTSLNMQANRGVSKHATFSPLLVGVRAL